jgi:hypothetical protein
MVLDFLKIKNISMEITRTVDTLGNICYRNESGQYHREDGPAIEYADGSKAWYINGKLHREDGPAFEEPNGYKAWWINGVRHREDGPARIHPNGNKYWYLQDKELAEEDWEQEVLKNRLNRIKYL